MVVLVTGATGFIGSNLVKLLVNKNYKVNIIVRNQATATKKINENQINYHLYDGSLLSLEKIVSTCKPDIIYHLASEFIVSHSLQDIKKLIDANILFGTQLIELSSKEKTLHLVNISTNWKYYNHNSYNPVNLYSATKKAFEDILKYYVDRGLLNVINLILFDVYGPNDNRNKLLPLVFKALNQKRKLSLTQGEQKLDLVYIDDVINAIDLAGLLLFNNKAKGFIEYKVSSKNLIKLKDLLNIVQQISNKKIEINWGAQKYRDREVFLPWQGGKNLPEWSPLISLEEGIKKILRNNEDNN